VNPFLEWISRIFGSWKFWVIVPPWDIGVRIRFGKVANELPPGAHWRIPLVDDVVLVNTRPRSCNSMPVSLQAERGMVEFRQAIAIFAVTDPVLAMMSFSAPSDIIAALLTAEVAAARVESECLDALRACVAGKGVRIDQVRFVESAKVRAYRLMQHGGGTWCGPSPAASGPVSVF
jgi:hypothetical protein